MQGRRGQLFNLAVKRLCAGPVFFQMLSPALIRQPGNSREAALVASGDDIVLRQRSGGDNEIVRTDRRSIRRKLRREPGMDTGSNSIERKNRESGQQAFDESLSSASLRRVGSAMHPVKQLGCGNCRDRKVLFGVFHQLCV